MSKAKTKTKTKAEAKTKTKPTAAASRRPKKHDAAQESGVRTNTKLAKTIAMLDVGATVSEIAKSMKWTENTVRGVIYGALKKRGVSVGHKTDDRGSVYFIKR